MSVTRTCSTLLCLLLFWAGATAWLPAQEPPSPPAPAAPPAAKPENKPAPKPKPDPAKVAKPDPAPVENEEFGFQQIEMLATVMELIRQNYVDEKKISYESLINSALEGMLANLDPHCQFMHPEIFQQLQEDTGSTYEGVGITVALRGEVLTIVAVREEGPAGRAGILPGDQIIKINEFMADKVGLTEAMQLMRGKPGQKMKLTLRRPANNQLLEVEMMREVIVQSTVMDVMMLHPRYAGSQKIGYLRLLQFSEPTLKELADGLDELERKGMQGLVLDLRNNPGGLLSSAVGVCGEFVPPNTMVLTTEGRSGVTDSKAYRTPPRKERARDYPLAILVNHGSASGAEVVAGALQDLHRAIIVGETTFGKGSVQSIIPVPAGSGSAIRLTTAKYYTPSKRTIHENGVKPNIVATLIPQDEQNLMQWFRRETLPVQERKRVESWTDSQLARAADALKGVLVYTKTVGQPEPAPENVKPSAPAPTPVPKPEETKPAPETQPKPETEKPAPPTDAS